VPEFRPFCKQNGLPPFHFFLYHVLHALEGIDNFMYRIHKGEVIKIKDFWPRTRSSIRSEPELRAL
jgi:chloramphenicol O-acetyltransferase